MKYNLSFTTEFKKHSYKGSYIALEGIDGSGKSYQLDALASELKKQGKEVLVTREPRKDSGALHGVIMDVLLGKIKLPPLAIQYLFTADRISNQHDVIIPALKEGKIVLSDRSFWSIIPYTFADLKLEHTAELSNFLLMNQWVLSPIQQALIPDTTFFLAISVETAMARLSGKSAQKEIFEKKSKIERHHKAYHWLVDEYASEFTRINGELSEEEVTKTILANKSIFR